MPLTSTLKAPALVLKDPRIPPGKQQKVSLYYLSNNLYVQHPHKLSHLQNIRKTLYPCRRLDRLEIWRK